MKVDPFMKIVTSDMHHVIAPDAEKECYVIPNANLDKFRLFTEAVYCP